MSSRLMYVLAIALFAVAPSGRAMAAPQVLAVLPSASGISFNCQAGRCIAELSTYCLQRDRDTPKMGAAYRPAHIEEFAIVVTDSKGARRQLSAANIEFGGNRGFMSATAVIPAEVVERLDIASATITVAENASLVPAPTEGDDNPLTAREIETATGALRQFGAQIVDNSMNAAAAQVLARVSERFSPVEDYRPRQLSGMWRAVRAEVQDDLRHPDGIRHARESFDICVADSRGPGSIPPDDLSAANGAVGFASSMLRCLQRKHDDMIRDVNVDYWNKLAGS